MERKIYFRDLKEKTKIRFYSTDGSIDFSMGTIHILVYFNGATHPTCNRYANEIVKGNGERQKDTFDINIPVGGVDAQIVISTKRTDDNIHLVTAEVI